MPRLRRAVEAGCVRNRPGNQVFFATLQGRPHAARSNPRAAQGLMCLMFRIC